MAAGIGIFINIIIIIIIMIIVFISEKVCGSKMHMSPHTHNVYAVIHIILLIIVLRI